MVPEFGPQLNLPTIYQVDLKDFGSGLYKQKLLGDTGMISPTCIRLR